MFNLFEVFLPKLSIFFAQPLWGISPQVVTLFVLNLFEVFLLELLHYFCGPAQLSLAHTAQLHIYCFLKLLQKQVVMCTWSFLSDPSPIIVCSCLSSFRQDVVNFSILVFHSLISPLHWGYTIMLSKKVNTFIFRISKWQHTGDWQVKDRNTAFVTLTVKDINQYLMMRLTLMLISFESMWSWQHFHIIALIHV